MKLGTIGVGNAGSKIVDEMIEFETLTDRNRCRHVLVINTARTDLAEPDHVLSGPPSELSRKGGGERPRVDRRPGRYSYPTMTIVDYGDVLRSETGEVAASRRRWEPEEEATTRENEQSPSHRASEVNSGPVDPHEQPT